MAGSKPQVPASKFDQISEPEFEYMAIQQWTTKFVTEVT